jgi:hypothetical protein
MGTTKTALGAQAAVGTETLRVVGFIRVDEATGQLAGLELADGKNWPISGANELRFRYNSTASQGEYSENGGPWTPFGGGVPGGQLVFADIAAMAAYVDGALDDSSVCAVATLLCQWQIDRASTAAPDGITVVACQSGIGSWHRCDPGNAWSFQAGWSIDPVAGDDENRGDVAHPLATHDELVRRIGQHLGYGEDDISIAIGVDYTGNIDWTSAVVWAPVTLTYQGLRTTLYSGSVTDVTNWEVSVTPGNIADAVIPVSWTASGLVGQPFVMTSGWLDDCVGWIEHDLGGGLKSANETQPLDASTLLTGDPDDGDTFKVIDLTTIHGNLLVRGDMTVNLFDLHIYGEESQPNVVEASDGAHLVMSYCWVSGQDADAGVSARGDATLDLFSCRVDNTVQHVSAHDGALVSIYAGALECPLIGEGMTSTTPTVYGEGGGVQIVLNATTWGHLAMTYAGWGNIVIVGETNWWAVSYMPADSVGLRVDRGQMASLEGVFWGIDNDSDYGLYCNEGGSIRYDAEPTYTVPSPNCYIAGLLCGYGNLPITVALGMSGIIWFSSV